MKVASPLEVLQQVQPEALVPSSWSYGTFHQNNPVYINMVKAAEQPVSPNYSSIALVTTKIKTANS
jgi:hypothetical protein